MPRENDRLDDGPYIAELDPSHLFALAAAFPDQCAAALQLGAQVGVQHLGQCNAVVLAGMGGSAIAGDYIQSLFDIGGNCPFHVSRDYSIPSWVDGSTLVLCSSYSGNTEETLASYEVAKRARAKILCITSGGRLARLAAKNGDVLLRIPEGQPPRTALPYLFLGPMVALSRLGMLGMAEEPGLSAFLAEQAKGLAPTCPFQNNPAKQLAVAVNGKTPVVYGLGRWQSAVAKRWKCQINENAKAPCFSNAFPELDHNEILGWKDFDKTGDWFLISLEGGDESVSMKERRRFTFDLVPGAKRIVVAEGGSVLQKMLYLTIFGDYVSLYLAMLKGEDPGDIALIEELKQSLGSAQQ